MFQMCSWGLIIASYGMLNDRFNEISYDFLWVLMGCFIWIKLCLLILQQLDFIKNGHYENIFAHP